VLVVPDLSAATAAAAERIARRCEQAAASRGECAIALSGGETPRALYGRLAVDPFRRRIPWPRLRVFWGDERGVPPDDPRSNYRMAREMLLDIVSVPADRIHRMPAERPDREAAAEAYTALLRAHLPQTADGWPRFDLVLLGLGDDAHTASLFPHSPALRETRRAVLAVEAPHLGMTRMTLTPPVLNHAGEIIFLVAGPQKARAVRAVLEGPRQPDAVPAQAIKPVDGTLVWIVDAAAASALTHRV
jgi:6-phosphogluconolactonase